jgi:hypothetical protein
MATGASAAVDAALKSLESWVLPATLEEARRALTRVDKRKADIKIQLQAFVVHVHDLVEIEGKAHSATLVRVHAAIVAEMERVVEEFTQALDYFIAKGLGDVPQ